MKKRINNILGILVLIPIVLIACGKEKLTQNTFGIRHDKTIGEYEAVATNQAPYNTTDYPDFSPVVSFSYGLEGTANDEYTATGTFITSEWILTAGHNFYVAEEQAFPAPASGIKVLVGNDPNNPTHVLDVAEVVYHPSWITENQDFIKANDMSLVRVEIPFNAVTPALFNTEMVEQTGNTTWYAGYGDYSNGSSQLSKKHAIENILDRKNEGITSSADGVSYTGGLLAFDFDSPFKDGNTLGDDVVNEDESLLGDGTSDATPTEFEGATVQGDSGGPIFMKINGQWKVCGVLSGGVNKPVKKHRQSDYGDISVFIRTATHKDWIESVIY